jgi:Ni,Fe-hydrogenase III small subunit
MINPYSLFTAKITEVFSFRDDEFEKLGLELKGEIVSLFHRSIAIRELDSGSDNSTEIEMVNLTTPHYDVERFGISFVASPRHADVLAVTGAVTHNMEIAVRKTYDAMPSPKYVIAVGDDACNGGIFKGTYAVNGGVEQVIPVDLKIPGNPPSPKEILKALLGLMSAIKTAKAKTKQIKVGN